VGGADMSRQFRRGSYWIPESLHLGESLVSMTVCSQCGAVKGETNHWFIAYVMFRTQLRIDTFDSDPARAREETTQKLCGENCLIKAVVKHAELMRISQ
jgi:hypothetical protein